MQICGIRIKIKEEFKERKKCERVIEIRMKQRDKERERGFNRCILLDVFSHSYSVSSTSLYFWMKRNLYILSTKRSF